MESADALAAKRRVLLDALMMCLQRSRVCQVVDGKTVRDVLDSASGELWREGEFRLEAVWKLLVAQPGLGPEEVAPPLLVFKAYEKELGVQVRVPQSLSAIPKGEQIKLRDALGIKRDDFALTLSQIREIAEADRASVAQTQAAERAEQAEQTSRVPKRPPKRNVRQLGLAVGLSVVALAAIGAGTWLALRDTSKDLDTSDTASVLQLAHARSGGATMSATIVDPRWDALGKDEQKKVASQLLDLEAPKGIRSITLSDGNGATRALVNEGPNGRTVIIP
jgi:hypothetical protein